MLSDDLGVANPDLNVDLPLRAARRSPPDQNFGHTHFLGELNFEPGLQGNIFILLP